MALGAVVSDGFGTAGVMVGFNLGGCFQPKGFFGLPGTAQMG